MAQPLMPKATAVWLVENTALTFGQIADYCGLHQLEVQAIADGEVAPGMHGLDPVANGQLAKEEIDRCEADPEARLKMAKPSVPMPKARQKGARYTPISKRQDRPDAIAWLLKSYPELSDAQISRLIGTTKPTIEAVRSRTHRNMANIKPQSPVYLGLCAAADLEKMVAIARRRSGTERAPGPAVALPPDGGELTGETPPIEDDSRPTATPPDPFTPVATPTAAEPASDAPAEETNEETRPADPVPSD